MRQQPLFHADHEHDWELQSFRLVQRDERYGVRPVLHAVHIGYEAHAFKERGQRFSSAEVQVVAGRRAEFLYVLHALFAALLIEQPPLVATTLQHRVYDVQQVEVLALCRNAIDEVAEADQRGACACREWADDYTFHSS